MTQIQKEPTTLERSTQIIMVGAVLAMLTWLVYSVNDMQVKFAEERTNNQNFRMMVLDKMKEVVPRAENEMRWTAQERIGAQNTERIGRLEQNQMRIK